MGAFAEVFAAGLFGAAALAVRTIASRDITDMDGIQVGDGVGTTTPATTIPIRSQTIKPTTTARTILRKISKPSDCGMKWIA